MRARHRMSKLLLRHDVRFDGTAAAWTTHHREWLATVDLGDRGAQVTLLDYLGAIDALLVRRDTLEATIDELIPDSPWADTIARLRCLRGIDTLSAVGLCAEIGDWDALPHGRAADELPRPRPVREHAPASTRRLGRDHEVRLRHGRRLLVEAAWHYRRAAGAGRRAQAPPGRPARARHRDQPGRPSSACTAPGSAWTHERGKRRTIVAVAVARELAGFCWAIANAD